MMQGMDFPSPDDAGKASLERKQTARIGGVSKEPQETSTYARAAGRVGGRLFFRNRYVKAGMAGARITLSSMGRTAHELWLEVTGVFFLLFAAVGGGASLHAYQSYLAGRTGTGRVWIGAGFTLMFTYFGITSIARSRRK
jgi:hypothetical protein